MTTRTRSDAGFSLPEVLISMGIMMVVLAGTFSAMTQAMKGEELVRLTLNMNSSLRSTMDLAVRDFLQIGQGLPDSRRIGVPNNAGALPIFRPGPTAAEAAPCPGVPATFPVAAAIPAVTVGPGLGAQVNNVCSDVITVLAADGTFDNVPLRAIAADGSSIIVALPAVAGGIDIDDGGGDDIRVGDLIMLVRNGISTLMYASAVNGATQTISFVGGDPFRLNQFDPIDNDPATAEMGGTINQVIFGAAEPTVVGNNPNGTPQVAATRASRIRMLTYYVHIDPADAGNPRLVRQINMGNAATPNANTVGFGVEQFLITYDLVDGLNNWIDVAMTAADVAGGAGCGAAACSENQIRKVNLTLSMRSRQRFSTTGEFMRNSLYSQVACTQPGLHRPIPLAVPRRSAMKRSSDSGVALLSAILVLMLMSAMLVGFIALINTDQNASGVNRDQTQSYAAAHAGVEKLTSDLGQMFETNFSPTGAQVNALVAAARQPNLGNGTSYVAPGGAAGSGYAIEFNDGPPFTAVADGNPDPEDPVNGSQITDGVYAGLMGIITPYRMVVTSRTAGGSEVRMRRTMQTVAIPVFQFGIFSDNDLSFFAGPDFNFGGRVHTNQNLYLAQGQPNTRVLLMSDRVTAVGDIVRSHLSNGEDTQVTTNGNLYNGIVRVARDANCATLVANCRDLAVTEDSVNIVAAPPVPPSVLTWNPGVAPAPGRWEMVRVGANVVNPAWDGISRTSYNSWMRNGDTGARRLDLPIVDAAAGSTPIDLIRRPIAGDPTGPGTPFEERFFRLASVRVLLSDTAAEITGLPTVTATPPVDLSTLTANGLYTGVAPIATSDNAGGARLPLNTPLVTGFIKIERQSPAGVWDDVTMRVLNLGIAGRNLSDGRLNIPDTTGQCPTEPFPNAIIRLQRLRDTPANGSTTTTVFAPVRRCGNGSTVATDYWPNTFYDSREGSRRESDNPGGTDVYLGGVMHYVEFDVNNLRQWLNGTTDGGFITAGSTMNTTGFVFYFSDRRGNKNAANVETGEFGFEDIVNPVSATSVSNTGLDGGEDFNGNAALDIYGGTPRLAGTAPLDNTATVRTRVLTAVARQNPPTFFRRALKIVNAGQNQLPGERFAGPDHRLREPRVRSGQLQRLRRHDRHLRRRRLRQPTRGSTTSRPRSSADAVTLLSRSWNDIIPLRHPMRLADGSLRPRGIAWE